MFVLFSNCMPQQNQDYFLKTASFWHQVEKYNSLKKLLISDFHTISPLLNVYWVLHIWWLFITCVIYTFPTACLIISRNSPTYTFIFDHTSIWSPRVILSSTPDFNHLFNLHLNNHFAMTSQKNSWNYRQDLQWCGISMDAVIAWCCCNTFH